MHLSGIIKSNPDINFLKQIKRNVDPAVEGVIISDCEKKEYFLSRKRINSVQDIWAECCSYYMLPATIESRAEIDCIVNSLEKSSKNKSPNAKHYATYLQSQPYYTEQRDINLNRKFVSCVTGKEVPASLWSAGEPNNFKDYEACVTLNLNKNLYGATPIGLCDYYCYYEVGSGLGDPVPFICETIKKDKNEKNVNQEAESSKTSLAQCPRTNCLTQSGSIIDKNANKNSAAAVISGCTNKEFILVQQKISSMTDIWDKCCAYDMIPASIESREEIDCIFNTLSSNSKHEYYYMQRQMIFYTGQMDINLNQKYVSCSTGNEVPADLWSSGEPNNNEKGVQSCVALNLNKANKKMSIGLIKAQCFTSEKNIQLQYFFCEKSTVPLPEVQINKNTETNIIQMSNSIRGKQAENKNYASNVQELKETLMKCPREICTKNFYKDASQFTDVAFISGCKNKEYILSKKKIASIQSIWGECLNFGMVPASIESKEEIDCIHKSILKVPEYSEYLQVNMPYYTGQWDENLNQTFASCITGKEVPYEVWNNGEPNNSGGVEACVTLNLNQGLYTLSIGMADVLCDNRFYRDSPHAPFICERPKIPLPEAKSVTSDTLISTTNNNKKYEIIKQKLDTMLVILKKRKENSELRIKSKKI